MAEHAALHYNNVEANLHKAASVNHSTVVETQKGLEPECQKVSGITMDALLTKYKIDRVDFFLKWIVKGPNMKFLPYECRYFP